MKCVDKSIIMFKAIIEFMKFVLRVITIFLQKIIFPIPRATKRNQSTVFRDPLVCTPNTQNVGRIETFLFVQNMLIIKIIQNFITLNFPHT